MALSDVKIQYPGANNEAKIFKFSDALSQIFSTGFSIANMNPNDIKAGNTEVEFFLENSILSFREKSEKIFEIVLKIYEEALEELPETVNTNYAILTGMSIFFMISFSITLSLIFKAHEKIVEIYYGFNNKYINQIIFTTENFISIIQSNLINDNDDSIIETEEKNATNLKNFQKKNDEIESQDSIFKLKKKKKKGTLNPYFGGVKLCLLILVSINSLIIYFKLSTHQIEILKVFKEADIILGICRVLLTTSIVHADLYRYVLNPEDLIKERGSFKKYVEEDREKYKKAMEDYEKVSFFLWILYSFLEFAEG